MNYQREPSKNWQVELISQELVDLFVSELQINPILARALAARGFRTVSDAYKFLNPSLSDLHPAQLLPDYHKAEELILGAIERGEKIYIHGDYDVDGVSSTALFARFLEKLGANVITKVPHRKNDGYGVNPKAVIEAKEAGVKLFLTCDCGITAHDSVDALIEAGMKVVVTDHHTLGATMPNAHAIVNPHRQDSNYPFQDLSGSGVVFKLCAGLTQKMELPLDKYYNAYLDLAVLGTIADVMPLRDENRIIAKFGLQKLSETKKPGLSALIKKSLPKWSNGAKLRTYNIGYGIGPRLNAAGRIEDADSALQLLLTKDVEDGNRLADELEELNQRRRDDQDTLAKEAIEMVFATKQDEAPLIVIGKADWHAGIIGIAAGKLVEQFNRPVYVLSLDLENNIGKGSARSVEGFNVADAIRAHPELMEGGGHAMAAGLTIQADKLDEVRAALQEFARHVMPEGPVTETLKIESVYKIEDLTLDVVSSLDLLEPCGESNRVSLFQINNVEIIAMNPTRNPDHVIVTVRGDCGTSIRFPIFSIESYLKEHGLGSTIDMVIQPLIDDFSGRDEVKYRIVDYRMH